MLIQQLPVALLNGIWIGGNSALLLYLSIGSSMVAISFRKFRWVLASLVLLLVVLGSYAFAEFGHLNTRQITVYSIYKHTAIDFFDGGKAWSLIDPSLEEKPLKYAVEGNRYANGIDEVKTLRLGDTSTIVADHFFYQNKLVQFYDKRLFVVEGPLNYTGEEKVKLDLLLLRNTPEIRVEDLVQIFDVQLIVFDGSNKRWKVSEWKMECDQLGLDWYDVDEEGALVIDFSE
jgi:hypothetical protein